jgi:hypothetical protein
MTACLADTERYPATAPQGRTGSAIRPTTDDLRDVFLQNQALIEDVVRGVTRRYLLSRFDAEEFASIVRLRLIEDDYEVLRSFEGRSSLRTFLTVVVARLCLNYRNSQWGKCRASTAGQRLGPAVVRLEKLIVRDGLTVSQACEHTNTKRGCAGQRRSPPAPARLRHPAEAADCQRCRSRAPRRPNPGSRLGSAAVRCGPRAHPRLRRAAARGSPGPEAQVLRSADGRRYRATLRSRSAGAVPHQPAAASTPDRAGGAGHRSDGPRVMGRKARRGVAPPVSVALTVSRRRLRAWFSRASSSPRAWASSTERLSSSPSRSAPQTGHRLRGASR